MRKKLLTLGITLIMLFSVVGLTACGENSHSIPNGDYIGGGTSNSFLLLSEENHSDWFWKIEGNKANYYSSGFHHYKCRIVEESGILYFVGSITFGDKSSVRFEVTYNDETKTLEVKCPMCEKFWCEC